MGRSTWGVARRLRVRAAVCMALAVVLGAIGCGGHVAPGDGASDARAGSRAAVTLRPVAVADADAAALSPAQASRFLAQATFGADAAEIAALSQSSRTAWLEQQFQMARGHHHPLFVAYADGDPRNRTARLQAWFEHALDGQDQLRQRVAFALSEIMVVSEQGGGLGRAQDGLAWYYDILVDNAFGDFRTLLEEVTLAPAMGRYLSMLGNAKPDPDRGRRADENYAREVMQLFTIGLVQLNPDGTPMLDGNGRQSPTYTQPQIEGLARVFTGWWFAGAPRFRQGEPNMTAPMQAFEEAHDTDAKTIVGNVVIPAGGTAREDLELALDTLFAHPNVGPFISRQLIQKLVTSNPTPGYVRRVAAVFDDDGSGARGNLRAVVAAILLDQEARGGIAVASGFGKPREPLLALTHLWRAFDAQPGASGRYTYVTGAQELGQSPLGAPSVFNFYSPFYAPPGAIRDAGLVAPEFQLANESSAAGVANRHFQAIALDYVGNPQAPPEAIRIDLDPLAAQAADPQALAETLSMLMMGGQMDAAFRAQLVAYLDDIPIASDGGRARAQEALYLVTTSPQYRVQK